MICVCDVLIVLQSCVLAYVLQQVNTLVRESAAQEP
jgi:hypothetical protein